MKRIFLSILIIFLIFEILMFPAEAMSYASTGLTLWFNNMIPALFPFMVISGLIIRLDIAPLIVGFLHPFLYKIFRTNIYCEYTMIMGFLCGYPMGAVIVRDLLSKGQITAKQADFLLAFCNNIGPVFFCSLVLPIFSPDYHVLLLVGMYGIPLIYGFVLRYTVYRKAFKIISNNNQNDIYKSNPTESIYKKVSPAKNLHKHSQLKVNTNQTTFAEAFTDSLNKAVSTSLLLGACMIFFNMLRFLPMHFVNDNLLLQGISSWLLEVNGALFMTKDFYSIGLKMTSLLLVPFLTIGGLSCICQTAGILSETNCKLSKYLTHKVVQWFLWLLLTLLWLLIENLRLFYAWNGSA